MNNSNSNSQSINKSKNTSNARLEVSKSLSSIRRYEGINSGVVESSLRETVGQKISKNLKSQLLFKVNVNVQKNTSGKIHVRSGDNLYQLAQKFAVNNKLSEAKKEKV